MEVGVLLFDGADELDVIGPARVFWALDRTGVHLVSEHGCVVECAHGTQLASTTSYAACPPLDVLIATGGASHDERATERGRRFQQTHAPTLSFIERTARHARVMSSVCTGTFLLAGAGLLAGRRATTHWFSRQELVDLMAARGEAFELVGERVVDDGDLVTAGGVASGIDLGVHLVRKLFGDEAAAAVDLVIETTTPAAGR